MTIPHIRRLSWLAIPVLLSACGGGGGGTEPPLSADPKVVAATQTAQTNAACTSLTAFYWEIGNVSGVLASGQVGTNAPTATTAMAVASASKWIYGMYAAEKRGSAGLSATTDVPYLNFTSGYSNFILPTCPGAGGTIDDCLDGDRGTRNDTEATNATFNYNSGHMQKHASALGLGGLTGTTLAAEVRGMLGTDLDLSYDDAQLAGSVRTDATNYARLLRRMLVGSSQPLRIAPMLGNHAVCTQPLTCTNSSYSPSDENWHYSLGHWVEDDAATVNAGNEAYSSAGAYGFYPWVNQSRTLYGVLAREQIVGSQEGFASAQCGRLIRLAYVTGTTQ
jgi:hypothetical protein